MATKVITPGDNVYISQYYYYQNFSGNSSLYCGQYEGSGDVYRSILRFVLEYLPDSCTITDARLKLFIYRNDAPAVTRDISVYRALSYVPQNTVTFANQPLTSGAPEVSISVTAELDTYLEFGVKDLVEGWYTGAIPNNGIVVRGLETANALVGFRSSRFDNSNYWPLLEVDYVKGVTKEYPVENVVTEEGWVGSQAIPMSSRTVSFAVENTGLTNHAAVQLEISPDGVNWLWAPYLLTNAVFIIAPRPASGDSSDCSVTLDTTGHTGAYARVSYTRRTGYGETTLAIYATANEAG